MCKSKGFTLIELLAVIALLMAILMPSLQKARKLGQSAVCKAHLRQNDLQRRRSYEWLKDEIVDSMSKERL